MERIQMYCPDSGMESAFKMAGDLDGGETPEVEKRPRHGAKPRPEADTGIVSEKTAEKGKASVSSEKPLGFMRAGKGFTLGGDLDDGHSAPVVKHGKDSGSVIITSGKKTEKKTEKKIEKKTGTKTGKPGGKPILVANIKTKKVKNNSGVGMKELIRDIHMEIQPGTLVALLGTAGAGKSTVMNCLNGMDLQGVEGTVYYRGVDLMKDFESMKYLIGSVPQKKIFHAAFTPEEEFMQAAMLRLPADTSEAEIKRRVNQTLEMLSMTGVRKNRNSKLSGGEQTRVNVGIELVADRDLLCLDEPDQGLSPNYKHELFEIMHKLAHTYDKTVISIIHDVSEIDMFDQVVMLAKVDGVGRLAFSGSPAEAREYFGVDIRDAYALLERDPKRFVK